MEYQNEHGPYFTSVQCDISVHRWAAILIRKTHLFGLKMFVFAIIISKNLDFSSF